MVRLSNLALNVRHTKMNPGIGQYEGAVTRQRLRALPVVFRRPIARAAAEIVTGKITVDVVRMTAFGGRIPSERNTATDQEIASGTVSETEAAIEAAQTGTRRAIHATPVNPRQEGQRKVLQTIMMRRVVRVLGEGAGENETSQLKDQQLAQDCHFLRRLHLHLPSLNLLLVRPMIADGPAVADQMTEPGIEIGIANGTEIVGIKTATGIAAMPAAMVVVAEAVALGLENVEDQLVAVSTMDRNGVAL